MAKDSKHHDTVAILRAAWDRWMVEAYSEYVLQPMTQEYLTVLIKNSAEDSPLWNDGYIGKSDIPAEFIIQPTQITVVLRFFSDHFDALDAILIAYPKLYQLIKLE